MRKPQGMSSFSRTSIASSRNESDRRTTGSTPPRSGRSVHTSWTDCDFFSFHAPFDTDISKNSKYIVNNTEEGVIDMAKEKAPAPKAPEKAPAEEKDKKTVKDVHELSFVAGKGWAVKRQGSDKVIKYFKTKYEATEYIVQISGNQKTSVVIHLKNGKFQKFDNAIKALSYAKTAKEDE